LESFSITTAATTFIVVTTTLIITVIVILPDLTPKEDLYWNWKRLVIVAVVQRPVSLHL
jgi:hypothetical protein